MEKSGNFPDQKSGNQRADSQSPEPGEKKKGQNRRSGNQSNVKTYLDCAELFPGYGSNGVYNAFAGHVQYLGSHFDTDTESQYDTAGQQGKEACNRTVRIQPGQKCHTPVDAGAEQYIHRYLQKLYRFKL